MKRLIDKLREMTRPQVTESIEDEFLDEFLLWLVEEFDDEEFAKEELTEGKAPKKKLNAAQAKKKFDVSGKLQPPYYLVNPKTMPIPDSADMWWAGVAKAYNEGKLGMGGKRSKSYMWAMRYWKNQFKVRYGFRPKRTKQHSMMDQIMGGVAAAASVMGAELKKPIKDQKKGRIAMAARLIRAVRTTKGMASKVDKELKKQKLSAAALKGWESRKSA